MIFHILWCDQVYPRVMMIADYVLAELEMSLTKDVLKQLQWWHQWMRVNQFAGQQQQNAKAPLLLMLMLMATQRMFMLTSVIIAQCK